MMYMHGVHVHDVRVSTTVTLHSLSVLHHTIYQVDECEKMQKDMYLTLCQKFISVLGDHLARCDQQGYDYESPWFQATLDNFRQLLIKVNSANIHVHAS